MLVNLSDVLTTQGKTMKTEVPIEQERFMSRMGNFKVLNKETVSLELSNFGIGKAMVKGSTKMSFSTRCDRCLTNVVTDLDIEFERLVTAPDVETEDEESRDYMEGYQLDVEALMQNEILVNWPVKILCKEDCKGVCPKCGQNRNTGDCGCDTFVPDPRMAAIKDIFNANKEV